MEQAGEGSLVVNLFLLPPWVSFSPKSKRLVHRQEGRPAEFGELVET